MASTRCPACGAKNQAGSVKCRICGQDLRGSAEAPLSQPVPGSAVHRDGRLSGIVALAVAGVLLLAACALLLGLLPGNSATDWVRDRVPFLSQAPDDGWEEFTEPSGRWVAELPADRTEEVIPAAWADTGTSRAWIATLGDPDAPDTELAVQWTTVPRVEGEDVQASLASVAEQWGTSLGGAVTRSDDASFQGLPARRVTVEGLEGREGADATVQAVLIRRDEQLVILWSRSIYPDQPQFGRLIEGFSLL